MRAREQAKEEKPMTLKEVQTAMDADQDVTEEQVRVALSAEAENVMNTTIPTPTPADIDGFIKGEIGLDEKEEHEVPDMPSLDVQYELLDQAAASDPPEPPEPEVDPPEPEPDPDEPDNTLPSEGEDSVAGAVREREVTAGQSGGTYNTRTVPKR